MQPILPGQLSEIKGTSTHKETNTHTAGTQNSRRNIPYPQQTSTTVEPLNNNIEKINLSSAPRQYYLLTQLNGLAPMSLSSNNRQEHLYNIALLENSIKEYEDEIWTNPFSGLTHEICTFVAKIFSFQSNPVSRASEKLDSAKKGLTAEEAAIVNDLVNSGIHNIELANGGWCKGFINENKELVYGTIYKNKTFRGEMKLTLSNLKIYNYESNIIENYSQPKYFDIKQQTKLLIYTDKTVLEDKSTYSGEYYLDSNNKPVPHGKSVRKNKTEYFYHGIKQVMDEDQSTIKRKPVESRKNQQLADIEPVKNENQSLGNKPSKLEDLPWITSDNGNRYRGELDNQFTGKGQMLDALGRVYVGALKDGKPDGLGKMIYFDGSTYEGEFKEGKRHGEGNYAFKNQEGIDQVQRGKFINNAFYPWITLKDGCYYRGELINDLPHGLGEMSYNSGILYTGNFKNGKPDGSGKIVYAGRLNDNTYQTATYNGEFKDGKRHGYGKFHDYDNTIHAGYFENDKFIGTVKK